MAQDQTFDVSARKFHQFVCVALLAAAFIVGPEVGLGLVALVGVVLAIGRFWWPADIFRQLAWRVLEPKGVLKRRDAVEDHANRRVARALGGAVLLAAALLLALGESVVSWVVVAGIAVMIFLDAAFDF